MSFRFLIGQPVSLIELKKSFVHGTVLPKSVEYLYIMSMATQNTVDVCDVSNLVEVSIVV